MPGWRRGYLIAPLSHIRSLQKIFGNFFISTNEFVQWAGVAALRGAGEDARRFRQIFDERRRATIAGLRPPGLGVALQPTGAVSGLAHPRRYTPASPQLAFPLLN